MRYGAGALLVDERNAIGETQNLQAALLGQLSSVSQAHLDQKRIAGVDGDGPDCCGYEVQPELLLKTGLDQVFANG